MTKLIYSQAYNKIIEAYFNDEIRPYNANFCFCGTLAPEAYSSMGFKNWNSPSEFQPSLHFYTFEEYAKMERALFVPLGAFGYVDQSGKNVMTERKLTTYDEGYEDTLFEGMCAALEVLKQIHIERGEIIDETPLFTKRELVKI